MTASAPSWTTDQKIGDVRLGVFPGFVHDTSSVHVSRTPSSSGMPRAITLRRSLRASYSWSTPATFVVDAAVVAGGVTGGGDATGSVGGSEAASPPPPRDEFPRVIIQAIAPAIARTNTRITTASGPLPLRGATYRWWWWCPCVTPSPFSPNAARPILARRRRREGARGRGEAPCRDAPAAGAESCEPPGARTRRDAAVVRGDARLRRARAVPLERGHAPRLRRGPLDRDDGVSRGLP